MSAQLEECLIRLLSTLHTHEEHPVPILAGAQNPARVRSHVPDHLTVYN